MKKKEKPKQHTHNMASVLKRHFPYKCNGVSTLCVYIGGGYCRLVFFFFLLFISFGVIVINIVVCDCLSMCLYAAQLLTYLFICIFVFWFVWHTQCTHWNVYVYCSSISGLIKLTSAYTYTIKCYIYIYIFIWCIKHSLFHWCKKTNIIIWTCFFYSLQIDFILVFLTWERIRAPLRAVTRVQFDMNS